MNIVFTDYSFSSSLISSQSPWEWEKPTIWYGCWEWTQRINDMRHEIRNINDKMKLWQRGNYWMYVCTLYGEGHLQKNAGSTDTFKDYNILCPGLEIHLLSDQLEDHELCNLGAAVNLMQTWIPSYSLYFSQYYPTKVMFLKLETNSHVVRSPGMLIFLSPHHFNGCAPQTFLFYFFTSQWFLKQQPQRSLSLNAESAGCLEAIWCFRPAASCLLVGVWGPGHNLSCH